jgi:DNA gyrase subunit A
VSRQLEFGQSFARDVVEVSVADEMSESFLAYSLSVITSRAIPDVRDGLKPVQRRILWSMLQMGIRPGTPFRKSARIVGDTMGRYHPHGDAAIYDTLVRMGQDFARMVPFIDPQGNFGSLDDPPAAARYTECRLAEPAMDMVRELDEDTVDFRPTYDGEGDEPVVLPAALPGILVNGTSGIAVGMATNMAPHNLREVAAAIHLVMTKRRPKPTIDELMAVLPGPDFPSGGVVVDDGLREAYETGRGSFRIRGRAHVEQITQSRQAIVVTELPYLVGPERVIAKVQELANNGRLVGIEGIADLSDMNGLRIQIDVKPAVNPQVVLQELFRLTPMEESFGVNNVVLVKGVPTTLGLFDICQEYIDHRLEVVVRRTTFRLAKAQDRLHILEGLLIALDAIDEAVAIIRSSQDVAEARERLIERFSLSAVQAAHILDMPLRRLTALAKRELEEEADGLRGDIAEYERLLGSEDRRRKLVLSELDELVARHGKDRKAEIISADEIPVLEVPTDVPTGADPDNDEPCVVTLSTSGNLGRVASDGAKKGVAGRHDLIASAVVTSTASPLAAITTEGRAFVVLAGEAGDAGGRTRGNSASQQLGLNNGEAALCLVAEGPENVVLVTKAGVVKQLTAEEVLGTKSGRTVVSLKDGDQVVAAFRAAAGTDMVVVASDGQTLRMPVDSVSVQGRGAGGVAGMKLRSGSVVVGAGVILGDGVVLTVTSELGAKATPFEEFETKGRGGQGVRIAKLNDSETVTIVWLGSLASLGGPGELLAQMADDDDPTKLDPNPVGFSVEPTKRDLVPTRTERQVRSLGPSRW